MEITLLPSPLALRLTLALGLALCPCPASLLTLTLPYALPLCPCPPLPLRNKETCKRSMPKSVRLLYPSDLVHKPIWAVVKVLFWTLTGWNSVAPDTFLSYLHLPLTLGLMDMFSPFLLFLSMPPSLFIFHKQTPNSPNNITYVLC